MREKDTIALAMTMGKGPYRRTQMESDGRTKRRGISLSVAETVKSGDLTPGFVLWFGASSHMSNNGLSLFTTSSTVSAGA